MKLKGVVVLALAVFPCKSTPPGDSTTTTTPPPSPPPPGPGSGPTATEQDCKRVAAAARSWLRILQAYRDLQPQAVAERWSNGQYDTHVADKVNRESPPGSEAQPGGDLSPRTNPCTCVQSDVEPMCHELFGAGFPPVLCHAYRAHENVHAQLCQENKLRVAGDPERYECVGDKLKEESNPQLVLAQEEKAYAAHLAVLAEYEANQCGRGCRGMASAKGFTSKIEITYERSNKTPYFDETVTGNASLTGTLATPPYSLGIGGYNKHWQGKAVGTGKFDAVTKSSGSESFEGHGDGPLVPKVAMGRFNDEILRIDDKRCVYAFETSAVIAATWSDGVTGPDGVGVVLGDLPIAPGATSLSGSKTLGLPISQFDWPGPSATLPSQPNDSRKEAMTGSLRISWTFTPK